MCLFIYIYICLKGADSSFTLNSQSFIPTVRVSSPQPCTLADKDPWFFYDTFLWGCDEIWCLMMIFMIPMFGQTYVSYITLIYDICIGYNMVAIPWNIPRGPITPPGREGFHWWEDHRSSASAQPGSCQAHVRRISPQDIPRSAQRHSQIFWVNLITTSLRPKPIDDGECKVNHP